MEQWCPICHTWEQNIRLVSRAGPWGWAVRWKQVNLDHSSKGDLAAGWKAGRLEHLNQVDGAEQASPCGSPSPAQPSPGSPRRASTRPGSIGAHSAHIAPASQPPAQS